MAQSGWVNTCCNPFDKPNHSAKRKNLRSVTEKMCERVPSLQMGSRICDDCRKKVSKLPPKPASPDPEASDDEIYVDPPEMLASLNQYLGEIGETPICKSKLQQRSSKYSQNKIEKITTAVRKVVDVTDVKLDKVEGEMIAQLKEKFVATVERSEKVQILTVLPRSWSIKKVQVEFGASNYMVRKAKELVKEKGILSTPNPKLGTNLLAPHTIELVCGFWESDEVSRMMPGKKDFVSVKQGEKRVHVQKRLVLSNLKEAYQLFKEKFPDQKIGFSKFAELRPKHCVLAGASGTHSVCVCTIHQNVKLMILGAKLLELTSQSDFPLASYHHCLALMICNPPQPSCYLGACDFCPGTTKLVDNIVAIMDDNLIDTVVFKQWVSVDRSTLETVTSSVDEFADTFREKLELLLPHSFIAAQQNSFYNNCKSSLLQGEVVVTADFSENYSFVLQDSVQGFHWNNSQATIHPFVVYYKECDKLCHISYVIISDCLHHDTAAVYLFQKHLMAFLKAHLVAPLKKVMYFSDGAAAQYKNRKNFINLCCHEEDFGVPAQWHFSATSHGKGACDGLGGTVKRLAAKASLQRPYDEQIMTPRQLYEWASSSIPSATFQYCTTEEYERQVIFLEERFKRVHAIPGTRKLHSYIPISKETIRTRYFSSSTSYKDVKITSLENEVTLEEISGFITCCYDDQWWLGCVIQLDTDKETVELTMLHPHGPSNSFRYPCQQHVLTLPLQAVLTKVDPRTVTGRVFTLSRKEAKEASEKLKKHIF